MSERATQAIVDLGAVRENARALLGTLTPGTLLMAVVKADAYGHGAAPVARAAVAGGATWLGVACVDEGVTLRQAGIVAPLLVLGPVLAPEFPAAVAHDLTLALASPAMAGELAGAAKARGQRAAAHIEVDSGMNRHGVLLADLPDLLEVVRQLPSLRLGGLFTHFACAESPAHPTNEQQLRALLAAREAAMGLGFGPLLAHAANSAASLFLRRTHLDMVRAGIALYGYPPERQEASDPLPGPPLPTLRPALTWRTAVARRWTLQPGDGVSYGLTYRAQRPTPVALLPVGYGDGLARALSNRGAAVLVRGRRAPIVGRICMDQTVIDVSDMPEAAVGDDVVLIGSQAGAWIGADELGALAGTNSYETLCRIAPRVPRRYLCADG